MRKLRFLFVAGLLSTLIASSAGAVEAPVTLTLTPDLENSAVPTMGDHLRFWSTITNTSAMPLEGLVAWISLVEIDPGNEQPVDLEDWSAHKAISGAALGPGQSLRTDWPMRLIKGGEYRVVVSVTDRSSRTVFTSPMLGFHINPKPVLQSARILPVAFGMPLLLTAAMVLNRRKRRGSHGD
jgi:hypothetical protein